MKSGIAIFVAVLLCGCSSSTKIHQPIAPAVLTADHGRYSSITVSSADDSISNQFLHTLSRYVAEQLTERSLLNKESGAYQVDIQLTSYQIQEGAARAFLGVLAGPDKIESTVRVLDNKTEQSVGESNVTTSDGLGSGDLDNLVWMHAEEIASFLAGGQ